MNNTIISASCNGISTTMIHIESEFTRGFAGLHLIGNPSEVCREGKERARTALEKLGFHLPNKRLVISLSPGDLKKDGNQFDLPIAISIATLLNEDPPQQDPKEWLFAAELGLSGELKPVKGVVSLALTALANRMKGIVLAQENYADVRALQTLARTSQQRLEIAGFHHLQGVIDWFFHGKPCGESNQESTSAVSTDLPGPDFDDMILDPQQKTAALVSAAGLHNLLLRGTPGSGKSMFAMRLPSIFPRMGEQEHLEAMQIQSTLVERLPPSLIRGRPPFRHPHHQASAAAILGTPEMPGEVSLAHGGILFLDEFPEFRRDLLEALREPMESGEVQLSRSRKKASWRSRCLIIAACNDCPCGWYGSPDQLCHCPNQKVLAYHQKLSGPVLDRIDLHVRVNPPATKPANLFHALATGTTEGTTATMRQHVLEARRRAVFRNQGMGVTYNRDIPAKKILFCSGLSENEFSRMLTQFGKETTSNRAIIKAMRVARTLADLRGSEKVGEEDIHQAWQFQPDRTIYL